MRAQDKDRGNIQLPKLGPILCHLRIKVPMSTLLTVAMGVFHFHSLTIFFMLAMVVVELEVAIIDEVLKVPGGTQTLTIIQAAIKFDRTVSLPGQVCSFIECCFSFLK